MKKVMILGLGKTMEQAPIEYDGEIWTCNDGATRRTQAHGKPYITAMFNMHNLNVAFSSEKQAATLCEVFHIPVIGVQEYPWLRTSRRFPREAVLKKIGRGRDIFSDVICYMFALAIYDGFEQVDIWGVHMHPVQRDSQESALVHYWLGRVEGAGIKVNIHDYNDPHCAILTNGVYWTGPGSYGHWNPEYRLGLEQEAKTKPMELPDGMLADQKMPIQEVAK